MHFIVRSATDARHHGVPDNDDYSQEIYKTPFHFPNHEHSVAPLRHSEGVQLSADSNGMH